MLPATHHAPRMAILSVCPHATPYAITLEDGEVTYDPVLLTDPDAIEDAYQALTRIRETLDKCTGAQL